MPAGPLAALFLALFLPAAGGMDGLSAAVWSLWLMSPAIAWLISRPPSAHKARLSGPQALFLGSLSRKTCGFF